MPLSNEDLEAKLNDLEIRLEALPKGEGTIERLEALESRVGELVDTIEDLEAALGGPAETALSRVDGPSNPSNPGVFPGPALGVQTLKTSYLCACGERAVVTHGFPGQAVRGFCGMHERTAQTRIELEPGRTLVASIQRLDG